MKFLKFFLLTSFLLSFQTTYAQEKAETVITNARKKAKAENKNVMVFFHASWCGWCKKMEKKMNLPTTKDLFQDNYVLASLDVLENGEKEKLENPGGEDWMAKYGGKDAGLPYFVFLDHSGKVLDNSFSEQKENLGCPSTPAEIESFIVKLGNTSKLSTNQLEIIRKVFSEK